LTKLLPYILSGKYISILALEMASPGNRRCVNCIGTLSLRITASTALRNQTGGKGRPILYSGGMETIDVYGLLPKSIIIRGPIYKISYDNLTKMRKLRSTYDGRLIYKTSYEGRKAFLRHDSVAKL